MKLKKKYCLYLNSKHIEWANQERSCYGADQSCPIAQCIQDKLDPGYVSVGNDVVTINDTEYKLNKLAAERVIYRFDSLKSVKPQHFTLIRQ